MCRFGSLATALALLVSLCSYSPVVAQSSAGESPAKLISLDYPGAPEATVEANLSFGLFNDLFGITDSALQGIAEAALRFGQKPGLESTEAVKLTAEQIAAVQKVMAIVKGSIQGVEVRAFDDLPDGTGINMMNRYAANFSEAGWEQVLKAKGKRGESIQVSLMRGEGAIRGAFVMGLENNKAFVALVRCDISPENAKQLGDTLASTALELGLAEQLQVGLEEIRKEFRRELKKAVK